MNKNVYNDLFGGGVRIRSIGVAMNQESENMGTHKCALASPTSWLHLLTADTAQRRSQYARSAHEHK